MLHSIKAVLYSTIPMTETHGGMVDPTKSDNKEEKILTMKLKKGVKNLKKINTSYFELYSKFEYSSTCRP
jgi:hypothetical protein